MAVTSERQRKHKPSIKYKSNALDGSYVEAADFDNENYFLASSGDGKKNCKKIDNSSSQILSTRELISAVGQMWNFASRPLLILQPRKSWKHHDDEFQQENRICNCYSLSLWQQNSDFIGVSQKKPLVNHHSGRKICSSIFKSWKERMPLESWKNKELSSIVISYKLRFMYGWMTDRVFLSSKHQDFSNQFSNIKTSGCSLSGDKSTPASCCGSESMKTTSITNMVVENSELRSELLKSGNPSSSENVKPSLSMETDIKSLCSDFHLEPCQITESNESQSLGSTLRVNYHVDLQASGSHCHENNQHKADHVSHANEKNQPKDSFAMDLLPEEFSASTKHKAHASLAKQEHAFAGAMAGVFVSLCLHPVDTIKTVIQSSQADRKSIVCTGRLIICERGLVGLYRGITSNITMSAPISALYTFSYESVKGVLVPVFSKEYHSFAHCVAGGCASVATSFIFTPTEHVKQQMQVGSHYHSCWRALIGIVTNGGLPSLYAGWGAVLCRNVPHSVIKFYTYESLKQLMLSSLQSNFQLNILQTLVCGGLAGSTAALFTTPFDVVKTRLQTQIPGSVNQYNGVLFTLKEIAVHEGLKGLYRGLTPRLVMYMTQGAIFFASYESFKRLLSLEMPQLET